MNFSQTPESKAADHALNARLSSDVPDEPLNDVTPELRLARIVDYQAESLAKPVALEACIGLSNGTIMQMGCRLADVIHEAMVGLKVENFARVQPVMDAYLRCMRQVDRLSHLEVGLTESRRKSEEAKPPVQRTSLLGFSKNATSSKKSAQVARW